MKRTEEIRMMQRQHCKHFNGVTNKVCDAGVRYDDVYQGESKWPCLKHYDKGTTVCEKREFPTLEEEQARHAELEAEIVEFFGAVEQGKCPHCKQPMEKKRIGRCVYAHPCGHRLYQGR